MGSSKSESFIFNGCSNGDTSKPNDSYRCRRKLQKSFDQIEKNDKKSTTPEADRTVLSLLSFNDNTRRALRNGAQRLTKTFNNVCTTFGTITQRFRISTKRRQILEEGPMTPGGSTPYARRVLGRTPTKLYSPFGIESPYNKPTTYDKENIPNSCN